MTWLWPSLLGLSGAPRIHGELDRRVDVVRDNDGAYGQTFTSGLRARGFRDLLDLAKIALAERQYGQLRCERCGLDPVSAYGGPHGEACIEVHQVLNTVFGVWARHT